MQVRFPFIQSMLTNDWDEYRSRRKQFVVACMLVPLSLILAILMIELARSPLLAMLILAITNLRVVYTMGRFNAFICPRCDQPFFYRKFTGNFFAKRCLNCDLPKWQACDESERLAWSRGDDCHCLACDAKLPADSSVCLVCGWTYGQSDV